MSSLGKIKYATLHCSANKYGTGTIEQINAYDIKTFGQKSYHYIIDYDGDIVENLPSNIKGAHVGGFNTGNLGICYIGGLDASGKAADTRNQIQKAALASLMRDLRVKYPDIIFKGHRDWSPDKDRDGKIEPHEWLKSCPCFDVATFEKEVFAKPQIKIITTNTPNDTLNVRFGAGLEFGLVGKLADKTMVKIINSKGAWKYIQAGHIIGWVNSQYLKQE